MQQSQAELVLSRFGGQPMEMVRMTGLSLRQVRHALKNGFFQERDRLTILRRARDHGIPHTPFDYIAYLTELADDRRAADQGNHLGAAPIGERVLAATQES